MVIIIVDVSGGNYFCGSCCVGGCNWCKCGSVCSKDNVFSHGFVVMVVITHTGHSGCDGHGCDSGACCHGVDACWGYSGLHHHEG